MLAKVAGRNSAFSFKGGHHDLMRAADLFQAAMLVDPDYCAAHSGRARAVALAPNQASIANFASTSANQFLISGRAGQSKA